MRRFTCTAAALAAATLMGATSARAQSTRAAGRGYVALNGWFAAAGSFAGVERPIINAEAASVNTTYELGGEIGVDGGAGVRIARRLSIGVDVSRFSTSANGTVTAQVPHPFYFDRARSVAGSTSNLSRAETAVHAQLTWSKPVAPRWRLGIAGGPSWFRVDQDVVSSVAVAESYPFDTATFASAIAPSRSGSRFGFNAGADLAYTLRRRVGVGFGANFSRARVPLTSTLTVDAGGIHVGGGLRLQF